MSKEQLKQAYEQYIAICNQIINRNNRKDTPVVYQVTEQNKDCIKNLLLWALNQPGKYDLDKGIIIQGNVGAGKTLIMGALQFFLESVRKGPLFRTVSTVDFKKWYGYDDQRHKIQWLELSHRQPGYYNQPYSNYQYPASENHCLFDDLGADKPYLHFGTPVDVVAEVMEARYRLFKSYGVHTHFTTNLRTHELKERYGDRLESRILEMCNFVVVGGKSDSIDYRK